MSQGRNKYASRKNRRVVRTLLMEERDPIGVRGIPEASDEYDRYADTAYVMLMDGDATATDIEDYLVEIASNHMGLGRKPYILERSRSVAGKLIAMRQEFGDR